VKDYFGGGSIVVIFGSAALLTYQIIPASSGEVVIDFVKSGGAFLNFYIAALICGSILGMNRQLLIKAAVRYLPAIIGGVAVAIALVGLVGALIGYGAKEAIFYIGIPIMGGGMGAGAVPLSKIFGEALNRDTTEMLSVMIPALALGNALSIVAGGLLDKLGTIKPSLTGNGELMKNQTAEDTKEVERAPIDLGMMGTGLFISTVFYILGILLAKVIPVHSYALMIISVALVKAFGIMPIQYEEASHQWFGFIMKNLTPALLVGIGMAYTDLQQIIDAFTLQYILLVTVTVIGAILGAGFIGHLMGFYFIESAITAGLCMANMGGTGDVAVLSAAKRMALMPFAQISSRVGGAFMLILATMLLGVFAGS
jgi:Na+/citrate or Na+/malate symporter